MQFGVLSRLFERNLLCKQLHQFPQFFRRIALGLKFLQHRLPIDDAVLVYAALALRDLVVLHPFQHPANLVLQVRIPFVVHGAEERRGPAQQPVQIPRFLQLHFGMILILPQGQRIAFHVFVQLLQEIPA